MADEKSKRFTFDPDSDSAEVPTLTSLLYRKNAVKSGANENKPMTLEPTMVSTVITPEQLKEIQTPPPASLEVKKSITPYAPTTMKLVDTWNSGTTGSDHSAFSVAQNLFQTSAFKSGVVFEKQNGTWTAKIQLGSAESLSVWCDLEFTETQVPELTAAIGKSSTAEYSPLADVKQADAGFKKAIRAAFATKANEWLTVFSTGDTLFVLQSTQSIAKALTAPASSAKAA